MSSCFRCCTGGQPGGHPDLGGFHWEGEQHYAKFTRCPCGDLRLPIVRFGEILMIKAEVLPATRMSRQLQNKCRGVIWHIPVSTQRQMPVQEGSSDTDKKLCLSRGIQDEGVSSPVSSFFC